jgi:ribonuclease HI
MAQPDHYTFRHPPDQLEPDDRFRLLLFSQAVWSTRRRYYTSPFAPSFIREAASQISYTYLSHISQERERRRKKRVEKERKKKDFIALYNSLDQQALHVFTDGSSYGNPGPAGAGVYQFIPADPLDRGVYISEFISVYDTANLAELAALTIAAESITVALQASPAQSKPIIFIFIDSQYTLNMAQRVKLPEANVSAVRTLWSALDCLEALARVTFFHVPAHVGIFPNEVVDFLAKQGAHGTSTQAPPDTNTLHDIKHGIEIAFGPLPSADVNPPGPVTPQQLSGTPLRRSTRTPKPRAGLFDGVSYR